MPNIYFEEMFEELGCPKPEPAVNAFPKWFKDIPRYVNIDPNREIPSREFGTIRACPAVNDAMSVGYMLYLPADIFIDATKDEVSFNIGTFGNGSRVNDAGFDLITLHDPITNGHVRAKIGDGYWTLSGPDLPTGSKVKVVEVSGHSLIVESVK